MKFIRQGATHKVVLGPAVAVGDGFTPVTTLALSSADEAEAILHDNGTVVDISGYTWAAITTADGYYHLTLQSGISNTVGHLTIVVNDDSLCLPLREDFMVLEEATYDMLFAGSALGYIANAPVNVAQISGDSTAADNAEAFFDGTGYAGTNNVIPTVTTLTGHTAQTGDSYALANGANGFAAIKAETAAILTDTAEIGAAGAGLTEAGGTGDHLTALATQTSVDTIDNFLDTEIAAILAAVDTEVAAIKAKTDSLTFTVAGVVDSNALYISGDSTAADNLEREYDGTGWGDVMLHTTVASVTDESTFTLTAGSVMDDAYNGCQMLVEDTDSSVEKMRLTVSDYTGASKTIFAGNNPSLFTIAIGDKVTIFASLALRPSASNRTLDVTATGAAGIDWGNVENKTSTVALTGTTISSSQVAASVTGSVGSVASGGITSASFGAGAITAAAIATDAIDADALSTDAVTAIQSGLSTLDAAGVRTAVGLASANLDTQLGDVPTNSELATAIITGLTTALTEGYRSTGATGSVRDLLYEILANIVNFGISGTTKTATKLDKSTTAKVYTLDDATTPTAIEETS